MNSRDPLDSVLKVAASLTQARSALRSEYLDSTIAAAIARGWSAYAVTYIPHARTELRENGAEFAEMMVDAPEGLIYEAMALLQQASTCGNGAARGKLAEAHIRFRKFHKSLGYREIEDRDLDPYTRIGAGGGR